MIVVFKAHALERCKRRRVNPKRLMEQVRTIPPTLTPMEWTFPNGCTVVFRDDGDKRLIITVHWKGYKRKRVKYK